jgi:galactokinase
VIDPEALAREFEVAVGRSPRLYRAPGRVNLIGEHTDYNDGFVMPIALDRDTWVAAAPREDRQLVVRSREYGETATIDLDDDAASDRSPTGWSRYILGVAKTLDSGADRGPERAALRERDSEAGVARPFKGRVCGADLMIVSDVPIGAGLSSSAALEVACGYALMDLAGIPIDLDLLAHAAQRAEHDFVGTRCGIMDQMIACYGRAGAALCLDTRSLARLWLPFPPRVRVVVCNTMVRHDLASSEYNMRRADCETGVAALARDRPDVRALRDATLDDLDTVANRLSERVYRRCRHVITENARVGHAVDALEAHDVHRVGTLMNESHESLRCDYEVSCTELDTMAAIARSLTGVHGARMTGGGFGGCVVALVEAAAEPDVVRDIARQYESATGTRPDVWPTSAGAGVGASPVGTYRHG